MLILMLKCFYADKRKHSKVSVTLIEVKLLLLDCLAIYQFSNWLACILIKNKKMTHNLGI